MKKPIAETLVALGSLYAKANPGSRLSEGIRSSERSLIYARDETTLATALADRRLVVVDVGARGGLAGNLERYRSLLDVVMVEPEPVEAAALRAKGFAVIEALIAGETGEGHLNLTLNPGNASMLEPSGAALSYYENDHSRFAILSRPRLRTLTLDAAEHELGRAIDYLKLDTQGNELAILAGAATSRPLLVVSEVSNGELYSGQGHFFEIGLLMHQRGYIMFDLVLRNVRPSTYAANPRPTVPPSLGIPMHGDAYFMPDWMRPEGRAMIAARPRAWAALMVMHGMEEIVRFVVDEGACSDPGVKAALA